MYAPGLGDPSFRKITKIQCFLIAPAVVYEIFNVSESAFINIDQLKKILL